MRKIQGWKGHVFGSQVLPDIEFGPVGNGKNAKMLTQTFFPVEKIPELRTLILGIPLPKFIPVGEKSFLGPGFFFVASTPPRAASYLPFSSDSRSTLVCNRFRLALSPFSSTT